MSSPSGRKTATQKPGGRRSLPPPAPVIEVHAQRELDGSEAVLEVSTRTEASLSQLIRAIEQVSTGVSGAREANEQLANELVRLRQLLGESNQERLSLRTRAAALEQELVRVREQASSELKYLTEQQDQFVAGMLEEHDKALDDLKAERDRALVRITELEQHAKRTQTAPAVRRPKEAVDGAALQRELEGLRRERDRSREMLRRLQAQRDTAQNDAASAAARARALETAAAEAAQPQTVPAPARRVQEAIRTNPYPNRSQAEAGDKKPTRRTAATSGAPELVLDEGDRLTPPAPAPELEAALAASRTTFPPEELASAILPVGAALAQPAAKASPAKRKPNPTERPLGSYSVGPGKVEPERVGAASRWPRR
jgi:hypothetical protein